MAGEVERSLCESEIRAWTLCTFGRALPRESRCFSICLDVMQSALDYHIQKFGEAGKPSASNHVLRCLKTGEYAFGYIEENNWIEDIILAILVGHRHEQATERFLKTYSPSFEAWGRRWSAHTSKLAEEFPVELILPREGAEPRIMTYKGWGPLRTWLRMVFRNLAFRQNRVEGAFPEEQITDNQPIPLEKNVSIGPGDDFDRQECYDKLAPLFITSFDCLTGRERFVFLQVIVDEMEGKRIARALGVHPGTVTRIKDEAMDKVSRQFRRLAVEQAGMHPQTVSDCADLLLSWAGQSLIDIQEARCKLKNAQSKVEQGSRRTDVDHDEGQ